MTKNAKIIQTRSFLVYGVDCVYYLYIILFIFFIYYDIRRWLRNFVIFAVPDLTYLYTCRQHLSAVSHLACGQSFYFKDWRGLRCTVHHGQSWSDEACHGGQRFWLGLRRFRLGGWLVMPTIRQPITDHDALVWGIFQPLVGKIILLWKENT